MDDVCYNSAAPFRFTHKRILSVGVERNKHKMGSGEREKDFGWCNIIIKFLLFMCNIVVWVSVHLWKRLIPFLSNFFSQFDIFTFVSVFECFIFTSPPPPPLAAGYSSAWYRHLCTSGIGVSRHWS